MIVCKLAMSGCNCGLRTTVETQDTIPYFSKGSYFFKITVIILFFCECGYSGYCLTISDTDLSATCHKLAEYSLFSCLLTYPVSFHYGVNLIDIFIWDQSSFLTYVKTSGKQTTFQFLIQNCLILKYIYECHRIKSQY